MKIFILCGKARSGKDTVLKMIEEYYQKENKKVVKMHFASYLKMYAKEYFGYSDKEEEKPRQFLQYLGTDVIRIKLKKEKFLINRILEDLEIMENFFDVAIIGDARFIDEIEDIKNKYPKAISINVQRLNFDNKLKETEKEHLSENALNSYKNYNYDIINTNLKSLEEKINIILRSEDLKDEKND
ncbi:MAG: hypothetical protein RSC85_01965 [Bacilli bacterium]